MFVPVLCGEYQAITRFPTKEKSKSSSSSGAAGTPLYAVYSTSAGLNFERHSKCPWGVEGEVNSTSLDEIREKAVLPRFQETSNSVIERAPLARRPHCRRDG